MLNTLSEIPFKSLSNIEILYGELSKKELIGLVFIEKFSLSFTLIVKYNLWPSNCIGLISNDEI